MSCFCATSSLSQEGQKLQSIGGAIQIPLNEGTVSIISQAVACWLEKAQMRPHSHTQSAQSRSNCIAGDGDSAFSVLFEFFAFFFLHVEQQLLARCSSSSLVIGSTSNVTLALEGLLQQWWRALVISGRTHSWTGWLADKLCHTRR